MKHIIIIFFAGIILLVSCKLRPDNIGLPNYNAEILGPIVTGKYNGTDFIKDNGQFSQVGPDGLVTLMYRGDLPPLTMVDILPIPDQQFAITGFPSGQNSTFTVNFKAAFIMPNGIQLTDAEMRSGVFSASMVNTGSTPINYNIRLAHSIRNGSFPVVVSGVINPFGVDKDSTDLAGVVIDMTRNNEINIYNGIELEIILTSVGGPVDFANSLAGSTIGFRQFKPAYARGYLGTYTDSISGNFSVPIFDRFFSGELLFESPYLTANFSNSFGLSGQFVNTPSLYISGNNPNRDVNDSVTIGQAIRGVTVAGAGMPGGPPAITTATISGTNDNFPTFLSIFPSRIRYLLPIRINPGPIAHNQFITDTSKFSGNFEFGLPLSFRTNNLAIRDTLPFKMQSDSSLAKIVDGKLITFVNNGLPVEFYFQAYFRDEFGAVQDSLFENQQLVSPATISPDGRISTPSQQKFVTLLNILKADKVKNMREIVPEFRVKSIPEGSYVKIYNDFTLEFRVVGDLKFNILSETK